MKQVSRTLFILLLPIAAIVGAWQSWAWWSWASSPPIAPSDSATEPESLDRQVQIKIETGTSARQIGQDLAALGVIRSPLAWNLWARWLALRNETGDFQAGTYDLSLTDSLQDTAGKIWDGEVVQQSFTIPEGWNLRQMADYFASQGFFPAADFLEQAQQIPRDRFPWLPEGLPHLEGYLYPNTYQLPSDRLTPTAVIDMMLRQFETTALPLWEAAREQTSLSFNDWVTLASIVEKEAAIPEERPLIAGVFTNRLNRGQKLEADPTVEYGLNIRQTADQPLTLAQVRTPSPYNTYVNPGLPPTPIAAPGKASLAATLEPEPTEYIFFVARYDGTHVFSRTLAEHEAAVRRIRQERNNQAQPSS